MEREGVVVGGSGDERTVGLWFVSLMYYLDLPT